MKVALINPELPYLTLNKRSIGEITWKNLLTGTIGSIATTKLALGLIKPSFSSIKQHINEMSGAWLASIIMFVIYAMLSSFVSGTATLGDLAIFIAQLLTTNVFAVSIMVVIAYAVAIFTFRRGWNPDNFVIPIESSIADTMTTAAVIIAIALIV